MSEGPGSIVKPPRARVSDAVEEETPRESFERKRDYLEGFLKEQPKAASSAEPGGALYEAVIDALKDIDGAVAAVAKRAREMDRDQIILANLCGRGDKDIFTVAEALGVKM